MRNHTLEAVRPERAAFAALLPVRREHEMLDHELTSCGEQIAKRLPAAGPVEHITFVDLDPGQRLPLRVQAVAGPAIFLLVGQMCRSRSDPFFTRNDWM